jgi:selenium-binding protein 1
MSSAVGTSPGRLVEIDTDFTIIHEWPEDVEGALNILSEQFSPHGVSIDWERKFILTSDFVEPISILKPSTGIRCGNALRLWDLDSKKSLILSLFLT